MPTGVMNGIMTVECIAVNDPLYYILVDTLAANASVRGTFFSETNKIYPGGAIKEFTFGNRR
jgi:hypothetical protein